MLVVLGICVHDIPALTDDSHLMTVPLWPLNVKVPVFVVVHAVESAGDMEPPSETGSTVGNTRLFAERLTFAY